MTTRTRPIWPPGFTPQVWPMFEADMRRHRPPKPTPRAASYISLKGSLDQGKAVQFMTKAK